MTVPQAVGFTASIVTGAGSVEVKTSRRLVQPIAKGDHVGLIAIAQRDRDELALEQDAVKLLFRGDLAFRKLHPRLLAPFLGCDSAPRPPAASAAHAASPRSF